MAEVIFDSPSITVACISDTHNDDCRDHIPDADIFVHAGDMTDDGTLDELKAAYEWISALSHKVKVIVAGKIRPRP
jgi:3',5'-cyclic AMP phosphodiesterase CpdA